MSQTLEPLRPVVFAILLSLEEEERHGYAVMQAVNERLGRRALLGPGTLYRTLKELREQDWIERTERTDPHDERRQIYRITAAGRDAARHEAERLRDLVRQAEDLDLVSDRARP